NEEIGRGLVGRDPVENGELTKDNIKEAESNPDVRLKLAKRDLPPVKSRAKGPRYTPVSKRGDKPDAIAYILKQNPENSDAQICKLVGTTKPTINSVRDRTHQNTSNLQPRHPADLGLCTYAEYEKAVNKGLKAQGKDPEKVKAEKDAAIRAELDKSQQEHNENSKFGGFDFSNFMSNYQGGSSNEDKG